MGAITIFALAKMTTFLRLSGYSTINYLLITTKKVATLLNKSDHSYLIHKKNALPLLFKHIKKFLYNLQVAIRTQQLFF